MLSDYTGAFPRGSATIHPTYRGFGASAARGCSKAAEDGARDDDSSFLSVTSPISSVFANSEVNISLRCNYIYCNQLYTT